MADIPKMRNVFQTSKSPLTREQLAQRYPELESSMPVDREIESYEMGDGAAVSRWGQDDPELVPGFVNVWMDGKVLDLYDLAGADDNPYEVGDIGREACSLAQEAFGDGFWTQMIDPDWGRRTKIRMDKVDQRIANARPGADWDELLGTKDDLQRDMDFQRGKDKLKN